MQQITEPGIYDGFPADDYHADPCPLPSLSSSIAKRICNESQAHARIAHPRLNGLPASFTSQENYDIGTAAHALLLEGEASVVVVEANDWRTKAAREARDQAWKDGRVPILAKKWLDVKQMVDSVRGQLDEHEAKSMFTNGKPEQTLVWKEGNVWCRARLDWLHDDHQIIDDYKTRTKTANPDALTHATVREEGWDIQAAFYLLGLWRLTGQQAEFRFCAQETSIPYPISVIGLSPGLLLLAERKVEYAIRVWEQCLNTGEWPAYPKRVCYADVAEWEEAKWLDKLD